MRMTSLLACLALVASMAHAATDNGKKEPDGPPPPPIPSTDSPAAPEPEVTVVQKQDATVTEYRMKGKLYMMRVVPKVGKPYYLVDKEGNGRFNEMPDLGGDNLAPPRWVLLEF
ncbi:hypothetical protein HNQ50_002655 [Silvimonas terrae]|uniref:DUF2782 domain-containing protein n=1 Tax=Silvimonas terrae TaxID=300266 RepID=A0A840RHC1_9NEIS|nr:DUF2782 domain-containing protein [Silvimonas terrae]MBB5191918.1 hypothetical protein [Silvimonas terrae]